MQVFHNCVPPGDGPSSDSLLSTLRKVLNTCSRYEYKLWGFGESIAMDALWEGASAVRSARLRACAVYHLRRWWDSRQDHHQLPFADHVAPGWTIRQAIAERVLPGNASEMLVKLFERFPQRRANSGTEIHVHAPDWEGLESNIWVDCLYWDARFLADIMVSNPELDDQLFRNHVMDPIDILQDPKTGMFFHAYDGSRDTVNGYFWGRGVGWAIYGIVDVPKGSEIYCWLKLRARALVQVIVEQFDPGRGWHTLLDRSSRPSLIWPMTGYTVIYLSLYR